MSMDAPMLDALSLIPCVLCNRHIRLDESLHMQLQAEWPGQCFADRDKLQHLVQSRLHKL